MWLFSMFISVIADWMIYSERFNHTSTRKIINSIGTMNWWHCSTNIFPMPFFPRFSGQYSPAICLIIASYTGCNRVLTVSLLTLGVGLNGGIYSGFKINHLDITPRFAGILMAFTNCTANLAGLLAPIVAGQLIEGKVCTTIVWILSLPRAAVNLIETNAKWLLSQFQTANDGTMANSILHFGRCLYFLCNVL